MRKKIREHYLKTELYKRIKTDNTLFDFIQEGSLDGMGYWNLENRDGVCNQILRATDRYSNIAKVALSPHERMDGKCYPNGIQGDKIPFFSRIICVEDSYEVIMGLEKHLGTQFDAEIVDLFIRKVFSSNGA